MLSGIDGGHAKLFSLLGGKNDCLCSNCSCKTNTLRVDQKAVWNTKCLFKESTGFPPQNAVRFNSNVSFAKVKTDSLHSSSFFLFMI